MLIRCRFAFTILTVVCMAASVLSPSSAEEPGQKGAATEPEANVKRPRPKITISKETTYIIEPLRADGYVDYVAAINRRCSEGVTPENNAAALLWKAVGPDEIKKECRMKYFQMLGIPPLPEKGNYFVDLDKYVDQQNERKQPGGARLHWDDIEVNWRHLALSMDRPWSSREFSMLAEWLTANETPLALTVEASKRPRRYEPVVVGVAEGPMDTLLQAIEPDRFRPISLRDRAMERDICLARALVARAMQRLNEGKADEAWEDLLACHRLARLAGQRPTLIDALIAMRIDKMAVAGDQALLQHAKVTASRIAKMQDDLAKLAPMPKMADKVDLGERFMFLDAVSTTARNGLTSILKLIGARNLNSEFKLLIDIVGSLAIDWDIVLCMGNSRYNRISAAYRNPTWAEGEKELDSIYEDMCRVANSAMDFTSLGLSMLGNPRKAISERCGQQFTRLFSWHFPGCNQIEHCAVMWFELDKLAFALTAYRADQRSYPAKLADLTPKYTTRLPKDSFADGDLHYKPEGDGYLLYSVGRNGKDDGGRNYWDEFGSGDWNDRSPTKEEQSWDDIAIRTPRKETTKP